METSVSLLERLRTRPAETDWRRLDHLYRPFVRRWLLRIDPALPYHDTEDLAQEVLSVVVHELAAFHRERLGSFRRWLRTIVVFRLKGFWRSRRNRPAPVAGAEADALLRQLEEEGSELSRQWDDEHHRHVIGRLLELMEAEFQPVTLEAFRLLVFEDLKAADAAARLGTTVNAVLRAKSRVLSRLRQEGRGLLD
jgi:RNA polymerase sigma-70 factor (ECF subfamily)